WRGTGWRRWIVPAVYAVGVAAQGVYVLTHPGTTRSSPLYLPDIPETYAVRVAGALLIGDAYLKSVWLSLGWALAIGAMVVAGAGRHLGRRRRRQRLGAHRPGPRPGLADVGRRRPSPVPDARPARVHRHGPRSVVRPAPMPNAPPLAGGAFIRLVGGLGAHNRA